MAVSLNFEVFVSIQGEGGTPYKTAETVTFKKVQERKELIYHKSQAGGGYSKDISATIVNFLPAAEVERS